MQKVIWKMTASYCFAQIFSLFLRIHYGGCHIALMWLNAKTLGCENLWFKTQLRSVVNKWQEARGQTYHLFDDKKGMNISTCSFFCYKLNFYMIQIIVLVLTGSIADVTNFIGQIYRGDRWLTDPHLGFLNSSQIVTSAEAGDAFLLHVHTKPFYVRVFPV